MDHELIHLRDNVVVHIDFAVHIARVRPRDTYLHPAFAGSASIVVVVNSRPVALNGRLPCRCR
ncbi:hypothetical protein I551_8238 [Mycobacterium ulcerans str. Harvey]|uniref:Uncharacterized protein n=1 Tax=Mycobacterium ulcerans str. Harvey TaxID=1299332 RepID=A0ABP3A6Z5_MYCUL|nr:hypothetical protein I551_8238 [Mycobacterium ulcerans str. Harvey]